MTKIRVRPEMVVLNFRFPSRVRPSSSTSSRILGVSSWRFEIDTEPYEGSMSETDPFGYPGPKLVLMSRDQRFHRPCLTIHETLKSPGTWLYPIQDTRLGYIDSLSRTLSLM